MDHLPKDKNRAGYFGNVKNRLGSKLPTGVSQSRELSKSPLEKPPQAQDVTDPRDSNRHYLQPTASRLLSQGHHIRNPKLRQYYLQGTSLELNDTTVQEETNGLSLDGTSSKAPPGDTVFSISSQFNINSASPGDSIKNIQDTSCISAIIHERGKKTSAIQGSSLAELNLDADPKPKQQPGLKTNQGTSADLPVNCPSPSPDAEYDKLLDVEAVPMPDGQLCLLTLPPECCQGEGPQDMHYLKLFCRYITDCKGVVSGILLVTSNKIFFDPCKTHPLVIEHGCEEYFLSCSVDCLTSVTLFSDITHVHFNQSQYRWKGKMSTLKSTDIRSNKHEEVQALVSAGSSVLQPSQASEEDGAESRDMAEAEKHLDSSPLKLLGEESAGALGVTVLLNSAATLCCGGQDVSSKEQMDLLNSNEIKLTTSLRIDSAAPGSKPLSCPGSVMFVRLRAERPVQKKGPTKTFARRDIWLALSRESSDELHAYLGHWRPDLRILEGVEEEAEGEEGFVLVGETLDQSDVFASHRHSGEDWEILSMEISGSKPTLAIDRDPECLPEIVEESCILEASHVRELCTELPARTVGHTWRLAYSTTHHGFSLKSLYRRLSGTDSPVLIVIKDALDQLFGCFLSHPLRPSETFYGTGETFLFMLHPRFKCFRWTGENTFFIKGNLDSFAIGGGSGHFGLWLDETLYLGRSRPCYTFNNCCLSETDDFRVIEMEAWTFS